MSTTKLTPEVVAKAGMSKATVNTLGVGLHYNVPAHIYHADPCETPSLSSGILRKIVSHSIEHAAIEHPRLGGRGRESTKSMRFGSAVHAIQSGDESEIVINGEFDSYRTNAAKSWRDGVLSSGRLPMLERDMENVRPTVNALIKKTAIGITNTPFADHGHSEVTAIWKEGDAYCRARYDRLVIDPDGCGYADIWDWKTTPEIGERAILRSIVDLGYHIQAAFYLRGLAACLPEYAGRTSFTFTFVETAPPYQVRRVVLSKAFLAIGNRAVSEGLAKWQHALATNDFTAPNVDTLEIEPPAYLCDDDIITTS